MLRLVLRLSACQVTRLRHAARGRPHACCAVHPYICVALRVEFVSCM